MTYDQIPTTLRFLSLVCALALAGCAGLDAALEYTGTPVVRYMDMRDNWRIFDKPEEGRLMITPSFGTAVGQGIGSGLTFGAADTDLPKPMYQRAAEGWLTSTGRACTISDGYKLINPQWEFKYACGR